MIIDDQNIEVHASEAVTPRTFKRGVKTGKVQFYRVRKNGTTRHIPYLQEGSEERDIAEKVEALREKGVSVAEIAETMGVSQPTVRRYIERLRFARDIEKAKAGDVAKLIQKTKAE